MRVWGRVALGALTTALGLAVVGCASEGPPSLTAALVRAEDLPGEWQFFEPTSRSPDRTDICGETWDRPMPTMMASVAWAVSPENGPIFGQRIERHASAADVSKLLDHELELPCETTDGDGRWRAEDVELGELGDLGEAVRIVLVTSLDRPDSFNYQVAVTSGDVAVLAVLNVRSPDRALLDELVTIAWHKADAEGIVE